MLPLVLSPADQVAMFWYPECGQARAEQEQVPILPPSLVSNRKHVWSVCNREREGGRSRQTGWYKVVSSLKSNQTSPETNVLTIAKQSDFLKTIKYTIWSNVYKGTFFMSPRSLFRPGHLALIIIPLLWSSGKGQARMVKGWSIKGP